MIFIIANSNIKSKKGSAFGQYYKILKGLLKVFDEF